MIFKYLNDSKTKIAVNFGFKLKREIRESTASGEEFEAKYALMVTWKNVTFLGNSLLDINLRPVSVKTLFNKNLAFISVHIELLSIEKYISSYDHIG